MSDLSLLREGIEELGLDPTEPVLESFRVYLEEIDRWNIKFGLVNARGRDLIVRHLLDSLAGVAPIAAHRARRLADIGSGAGFPGIPLALYLTDTEVTLVEPSEKRSAFLRNVLALLRISTLKIISRDLESLTDRYDIVTFRAFRPLDRKTVKKLARITLPGGAIAAYKGRLEKIEEEVKAAEALGFATRIDIVRVPFLDEPRHIFWIFIPPT